MAAQARYNNAVFSSIPSRSRTGRVDKERRARGRAYQTLRRCRPPQPPCSSAQPCGEVVHSASLLLTQKSEYGVSFASVELRPCVVIPHRLIKSRQPGSNVW